MMLKKFKRRLFSRKNGGFTLVEVIVSAALLGVLLVGIIAFITPALSMMKEEETNSHASMVASSLENYITRSLRSTPYVKIVTNATNSDFSTGAPLMADGGDIQTMLKWAALSENVNIYEIRCISLRMMTDSRTGETKYMMYQDYVSELGALKSMPVFDDCFYDGLFPEVTLKQATNQYRDGTFPKNEDGTTQTLANRPALEIDINIYDDDSMDGSDLVFTGYGLTELYMIATNKYDPDTNKNSYGYTIYPSEQARSDDDAETANSHDVYIFYAARKLTDPTATP